MKNYLVVKKGFSLPELVIAVSIFAFLSIVSVAAYVNFDNRISVDLLAHQVAQFGREAQVSALSVKRAVDGNYPAYGIHFSRASSTSFVFFADLDGNQKYTAGGSCGAVGSECEKEVLLLQGMSIVYLCGDDPAVNLPGDCPAGLDYADEFDIYSKRPNPDAVIKGVRGVSTSYTYSSAQITIRSAKGYGRGVQFYNTGQVVVKSS